MRTKLILTLMILPLLWILAPAEGLAWMGLELDGKLADKHQDPEIPSDGWCLRRCLRLHDRGRQRKGNERQRINN